MVGSACRVGKASIGLDIGVGRYLVAAWRIGDTGR
jgi:hypothetical protein